MIFIDTDVLIWHQRGQRALTEALETLQGEGEVLATTSINAAELFHGAERMPGRAQAVGNLMMVLDGLVQVPFGPGAARRFGQMQAALSQAGAPLPGVDGLIAAIVLQNGGRFITLNRQDFARVHGLELLEVPEPGA